MEADYNVDDLLALDPGDLLEVPSPLAPLSEEPLVLMLIGKPTPDSVAFEVSLFGIDLGLATLTKTKKGQPSWTFK